MSNVKVGMIEKDFEVQFKMTIDKEHFIDEGSTFFEFVKYFFNEIASNLNPPNVFEFITQLEDADNRDVFSIDCVDVAGDDLSIVVTRGPGTTPLETTVH